MACLSPNDLKHFRETMVTSGVPEKRFTYYARWVSLYLSYAQKWALKTDLKTTQEDWLQEIGKQYPNPFLQRQAAHALQIYFNSEANPNQRSQAHSNYATDNLVPKANVYQLDEDTSGPISWPHAFQSLEREIRVRHYSKQTLKSYANWIQQFKRKIQKSPAQCNTQDVKRFLSFLALERNVSSASQNQAFNALLFFFRHVLGAEFGEIKGVARAKQKRQIPVVLSRKEVDQILSVLEPPYLLLVKLLYGCGLRISEGLSLRVQDLNFELGQIHVFRGKGNKHRTVPLPLSLRVELQNHLESLKKLHRADLQTDFDGVFLADRNHVKYKNAAKEFAWQWVFPAKKLTSLPEAGLKLRYHLHDTHVSRAIRAAAIKSQIPKRITAHTFRHSYATHLLQANYNIQTIQHLLGHSDIRTTMIYLHSHQEQTQEIKSPLDL